MLMLTVTRKQNVIKKYQTHKGDTGSSQVQIAILTLEIEEIVGHLKTHPKDHSSRRGLLRKVSARRNLLKFLKKEDANAYEDLIKKLKIKKAKKIEKPAINEESETEKKEDKK
jgi:small subunit ribosomal protein S15